VKAFELIEVSSSPFPHTEFRPSVLGPIIANILAHVFITKERRLFEPPLVLMVPSSAQVEQKAFAQLIGS
jgi:hypothetical protein